MYARLLRYLRPHAWRMVGTVASNVIAAALAVFSFTLLPLFLNALFGAQRLIPSASPQWITNAHERMVGAFLDPADRLGSVETMMIAISRSSRSRTCSSGWPGSSARRFRRT